MLRMDLPEEILGRFMLRMDLPGGVLRRFYAQNGPPRVGFKVVLCPEWSSQVPCWVWWTFHHPVYALLPSPSKCTLSRPPAGLLVPGTNTVYMHASGCGKCTFSRGSKEGWEGLPGPQERIKTEEKRQKGRIPYWFIRGFEQV